MPDQETRRLELPAWALPRLFEPARFKSARGGRGSSKSWTYAEALILIAAQDRRRVLCAREIQKTIKDSVLKLLEDTIARLGLGFFFKVTQNSIVGLNGSEFIFAGLRTNAAEIKSMEGIDICWVEEAQKVSAESWRYLIPTIRKQGSEIWLSWNPEDEQDPTSQQFLVKPRPGTVDFEVNWRDNPWFTDELRREMEYDYRVDPDMAAHVWEGKFLKRSAAQVFAGKYRVDAFERQVGWHGPLFGADFGFAQDPAVLVKMWLDERVERLYIEHEAWGVGVPLGMTWQDKGLNLPKMFRQVPEALLTFQDEDGVERVREAQWLIRGDSSRPETINHLAAFGFNIVAAEKWSGSVEDGIEWLRGLVEIVIHPRCVRAQEEARLYRYKVDKVTGDVLPVLEDKWNHVWDAVRYGCQPAIKKSGQGVVEVFAPQVPVTPELDEYDVRQLESRW